MPPKPTRSARLVGIDAARGVALIGMILVHVYRVGFDDWTPPEWMTEVALGRASALFAVLAGVGLALLTGGSRPVTPDRARADRKGIAARAAVIAAIGLSLGLMGSELEFILVQYAVMFLLALPFTTVPLRRLVIWAVGWTVLSPVIAMGAHWLLPGAGDGIWLDTEPNWLSVLLHPVTLILDLLLTGAYPVLQWFSFVLFGLVLGRLRLGVLRVQVLLVVGGALMSLGARFVSWLFIEVAGGGAALLESTGSDEPDLTEVLLGDGGAWWWFAMDAPHSNTTPTLVDCMGTAALVLGLCLLAGRRWEKALLPLAGAGAMTLTIYSAHLIFMVVVTQVAYYYYEAPVFWVQVALALAIGAALRLRGHRGPLETLAHRAGSAARSKPTPTSSRSLDRDKD